MKKYRSYSPAWPSFLRSLVLMLASLGVVALSRGAESTSGDWPSFGNGPAHTGYYPETLGDLPISDGWSKEIPSGFNQLSVVGDRVFLTTNWYYTSGMFAAAALDAATGQEIWRYSLPAGYSISGPTVSDGKVIFTRQSGYNDSFI